MQMQHDMVMNNRTLDSIRNRHNGRLREEGLDEVYKQLTTSEVDDKSLLIVRQRPAVSLFDDDDELARYNQLRGDLDTFIGSLANAHVIGLQKIRRADSEVGQSPIGHVCLKLVIVDNFNKISMKLPTTTKPLISAHQMYVVCSMVEELKMMDGITEELVAPSPLRVEEGWII